MPACEASSPRRQVPFSQLERYLPIGWRLSFRPVSCSNCRHRSHTKGKKDDLYSLHFHMWRLPRHGEVGPCAHTPALRQFISLSHSSLSLSSSMSEIDTIAEDSVIPRCQSRECRSNAAQGWSLRVNIPVLVYRSLCNQLVPYNASSNTLT